MSFFKLSCEITLQPALLPKAVHYSYKKNFWCILMLSILTYLQHSSSLKVDIRFINNEHLGST